MTLNIFPILFTIFNVSLTASANDSGARANALVVSHSFACEEIIAPPGAHNIVKPISIENVSPTNAVVKTDRFSHKFAKSFSFSADGNYIVIHHRAHWDGEQLSLRRIDTGDLFGSILLQSQNDRSFYVSDVDIDGLHRRLLIFSSHFETRTGDLIMLWNGADGNTEQIRIEQIPLDAFIAGGTTSSGILLHSTTPPSFEHPFYLRYEERSGIDRKKIHATQLVEWRNQSGRLILNEASLNYHQIIQDPFAPLFYLAT